MLIFPVGLAYMAKLIIAWPLTFLLLIAGAAFAFGAVLQVSAFIFGAVLLYVFIRTCTSLPAPELLWIKWIFQCLAGLLGDIRLHGGGAEDASGTRPTRPTIYAYHPHGLYAVAPLVHILRGDISASLVTIPLAAHFPVVSLITRTLGIISSDKENLRRVLKGGGSIAILIGGVREAEETAVNTMRLCADKTGIFELAIETDAQIVPVISYGENEIFRVWKPLGWFQDALKRLIHLKILLPYAGDILKLLRGGCPQVDSYMGAGLAAGAAGGSVETLRDEYKRAFEELYSRTRPAGYGEKIEWLDRVERI